MDASSITSFLESVKMSRLRLPKRSLRGDVGNVTSLMASIEDKGLLEPIVVRPLEEGFEVVAGERRYEACKRLGWRNMPCHVVELNDKEAFEVSLLENIQRETLNPIEEAQAFRRYIDEYGYGAETELAKRISKSQEYVSRRIGLLCLPEKVQGEIMRRRITPSVAQELMFLKNDDAEYMAETISSQQLTLREVRQILKHSRGRTSERRSVIAPFELERNGSSDIRAHRVVRELNKAIATLRVSIIRLGEVEESLADEWVLREAIYFCRDSLKERIDDLTRLRKKVERAQDLGEIPPTLVE